MILLQIITKFHINVYIHNIIGNIRDIILQKFAIIIANNRGVIMIIHDSVVNIRDNICSDVLSRLP